MTGTQFNWHDESQRAANAPAIADLSSPLFMYVGAFDKGTEKFTECDGSTFNKMFGIMDFEKYGQGSIQAQNIVDAGGRLFLKRVVADDACLANVIVTATVSSVQKTVQQYDEYGRALYYTDETKTATTTTITSYPVKLPVFLDSEGNETTEETDTPVMAASIKWDAQSVEGATGSYDEACAVVDEYAASLASENTFVLDVIKDNGRGLSHKSVRFIPDYTTSRGAGNMFYKFTIYDNNKAVEDNSISMDPEVIFSGKAYRIDQKKFVQINAKAIESEFERFINYLADLAMIDSSVLRTYDLINGATNRGVILDEIQIDSESVDLNSASGIYLANGDNGEFKDGPMNQSDEIIEAYYNTVAEVYNGAYGNDVYDVDEHLVAMILDANFPFVVKEAIGKLVAFRKDCMFFRDIGVGHTTFADIYEQLLNLPEIPFGYNENATITNDKSTNNEKFFANYITSYEIEDPNSLRYIEVTCMYDLAAVLVDHLRNHPNAPLAGTYNGFVLNSAIPGTLNFKPVNTPTVNQKAAIENLHANYAIFEGDQCVVQSLYTCQEAESQLSWICNVISIEYIMRVVRKQCPKQRFALTTTKGLSDYEKAVNKVLDQYRSLFDELVFQYTQDDLQSYQKIFAASIGFTFLGWAQTEYFDLYALDEIE